MARPAVSPSPVRPGSGLTWAAARPTRSHPEDVLREAPRSPPGMRGAPLEGPTRQAAHTAPHPPGAAPPSPAAAGGAEPGLAGQTSFGPRGRRAPGGRLTSRSPASPRGPLRPAAAGGGDRQRAPARTRRPRAALARLSTYLPRSPEHQRLANLPANPAMAARVQERDCLTGRRA